ncbi:MAG: aryl-sulfate sulfotransferase [Myxococcota bacterium]|nr:aryl-sulfate sulfotransferase [Myxococcota bacterium]
MISLLLLGCGEPNQCTTSVTANTHDAVISWSKADIDLMRVVFEGESRNLMVDGTQQRLAGLPPQSHIEVQLYQDSTEKCSTTFKTGGLPPELPWIAQSQVQGHSAWKGIIGTTMGEDAATWVLDNTGRFRWHSAVEPDRIVSDIHSTDTAIWHNSASSDAQTADSELIQKDFQAAEIQVLDTPYGHHVFHLHTDGSIAQLEVDIRPWTNPQTQNEEMVVGDRIVRITADGERRELFSLWEHAQPSINPHWNSGFYGSYKDWSHANSLHFSEVRNSYLVAFANLNQIFEIDATSGEVLLVIDSQQWFFTFETPVFNYPHGPVWLDDNQLMLFTHSDDIGTAVIYDVDAESQVLDQVWAYSSPISAGFLGQAIPLPDGHILVNFGGSGMLHEVDRNGQLVWQAETALGTWFGNVEVWQEWPKWFAP